jgi:hypothetical protein
VFVVAAAIIAPSLALLYFLDQRSRLSGHGLGSDIAETSPATGAPVEIGRGGT